MSLIELRPGSFTAKGSGFFAWWEGAGRPAFVLVTDPPHSGVTHATSAKKRTFANGVQAISRPISYGALTEKLRRGIAKVAAVSRWSAIWDRPEGMGDWKRAITAAGGVWIGTGMVLQTRGAPRLRGDGPGCRHLCLALARRKGPAIWDARPWAEYTETRPQASSSRPIPGTRSIETCKAIIRDFRDSCDVAPVVVDLCAGTGVILQASRTLGLDAIGWERDPKTFAWATDVLVGRGATVPDQVQLFGGGS